MLRFWLNLFLILTLIAPLSAQAALPFENVLLPSKNEAVTSPNPEEKGLNEEDIRSQKEQNAKELEQFKQFETQSAESAPQGDGRYYKSRVQMLESLDLLYSDILEALASKKRVESRIKGLESEEAQWTSGTPPKDFSVDFATLDRLRGQEVEARKTLRSRDQVYKSRQEALDEAKKEFQSAEQERRRAKEALETASSDEDRASLEQALALAQLKSHVADLRLDLRELEYGISKSYRDFFQRQQTLSAQQISFLEKRVHFTEEDLQRELGLLDSEIQKVEGRIETQNKAFLEASKEFERARQRLDENPSPESSLIEEVEAKRLAQTAADQERELLNDRLKRLKELKELWTRRALLLNGKTEKSELVIWQQQTRQYLDQIKRDDELLNLRLNSLRNNLVEAEEKSRAKTDADAETKRWLQRQKEAIQQNIDLFQDSLASLAMTRKLYEKFLSEQESRYNIVPFTERISRLWDRATRVWNYELTSVDDNPITVSKLFFAVILMVVGLLLAKRLSGAMANRLLPRFGVAPGVAAALRTLTYYALVLVFVLSALHLVRVPLTLFAVLGGAVAIGIGFGSQNMMNNFISGLILLIERPIKVGDIIETEGSAGIVEHIGGRSTQIRTFSNIHMIVPNSSFLEKSVVNWTLSDNMIRSNIRVGVAYGSPTRQVADLLKNAATEHGKVLKTPEPVVLFADFGNDALIFDLYFWLKIQNSFERRLIESDLRFMIEGSFSDAEITIAFPQRDIHFDAKAPLAIRLLKEEKGETPAPKEDKSLGLK